MRLSTPEVPVPPTLQQALRDRYACKAFDPSKKISAQDWQALKDCLRLAPSYYGLQPWRFLVVETPELRQKLREASWDQAKVTDCSHFVVIASARALDMAHIGRHAAQLAAVRGVDAEKTAKGMSGLLGWEPRELQAWAERQSFIPLGFAMLGAALLGIDSCPMEGIEPEKYDRILGLEGGYWKSLAGLALGYRAASDKHAAWPRVRFSEEEVFQTC